MMIAIAIAIPAIRLPNATFWSSSSSFQRLPGVNLSKIMNANRNIRTPSSAKTSAATKFVVKVDSAVLMSFPPAVARADKDVMRAVRTRIVAHGARNVPDFVGLGRGPAGPLDSCRAAEQQNPHQQIDRMLAHDSLIVVVVAGIGGGRVVTLLPSGTLERAGLHQ